MAYNLPTMSKTHLDYEWIIPEEGEQVFVADYREGEEAVFKAIVDYPNDITSHVTVTKVYGSAAGARVEEGSHMHITNDDIVSVNKPES